MTTQIEDKKQCECCGKVEKGDFHQFYYGKNLKTGDKKELPTQKILIGGSKSVYYCSRCLQKGILADPQVIITLAVFIFTLIGSILNFLGLLEGTLDDISLIVMPFLLALVVHYITGYFIFGGFFSFWDRAQTAKAASLYEKELNKQGFDLIYSPKQYTILLSNGLCQEAPGNG